MSYVGTIVERDDMDALDRIADELERARTKFGPMSSPHEAYAVILEELDEFWVEVKSKDPGAPDRARGELVQVAAMALRAITDCYGGQVGGARVEGDCEHVARAALAAALSVAEPCSRCAELEAEVEGLREQMADMVPATWDGLISLIDRWYPADVFTGESGGPGPRLVVLARELARLREAAQAVVDTWGFAATIEAVDALRAVLESDGAPGENGR